MTAIATKQTRYFRGAGKFILDGLKLGQVSKAALNYEIETSEKENFEGGGGLDDTITIYKSVSIDLTCRSFDLRNMALAFGADETAVVGAPVTDYAITAKQGRLSRIDGLIDLGETVVVNNAGTPIDTSFYEVSVSGITIVDDSIADDTALTVDYTQASHAKLEAAVNQGVEGVMVLEGMNDAETGQRHVIDFYRAKSKPMESFDLISNEDQEVTITFDILADLTKGNGETPESRFFKILQLGLTA